MGTLMDYAELAVQFGYITLFVVAFPLAPFLALANNYVEFRSDAFKLLTQMRRPVPRGAEDIGSWQGVFTAISCIAVVTNSALVRIKVPSILLRVFCSTNQLRPHEQPVGRCRAATTALRSVVKRETFLQHGRKKISAPIKPKQSC